VIRRGLVANGDGGVGSLATGDRGLRLGQCLAHVQLVVHEKKDTRQLRPEVRRRLTPFGGYHSRA